jgi:hypothetical protein
LCNNPQSATIPHKSKTTESPPMCGRPVQLRRMGVQTFNKGFFDS